MAHHCLEQKKLAPTAKNWAEPPVIQWLSFGIYHPIFPDCTKENWLVFWLLCLLCNYFATAKMKFENEKNCLLDLETKTFTDTMTFLFVR